MASGLVADCFDLVVANVIEEVPSKRNEKLVFWSCSK